MTGVVVALSTSQIESSIGVSGQCSSCLYYSREPSLIRCAVHPEETGSPYHPNDCRDWEAIPVDWVIAELEKAIPRFPGFTHKTWVVRLVYWQAGHPNRLGVLVEIEGTLHEWSVIRYQTKGGTSVPKQRGCLAAYVGKGRPHWRNYLDYAIWADLTDREDIPSKRR
jgi:hypothetical protein